MVDDMRKPPLHGITVLDFGHTVMGPSCGMILADLGADVIKVEPVGAGDPTRSLKGFGTGYFGYFNRNKRSISVDLKTEGGLRVAEDLVRKADVVIENFAPGTMSRLGLGYDSLAALNSGLIFASLKGFLPGPYENRLALDEVVQMMGGLAYMTGPTGRPLRAGTSVVDIAGGMFAVIAILAALRQREGTGRGQCVQSALYESTIFLMGQHLCYAAQSDVPVPPMPERVSAWCIYEPFKSRDGKQVFLGITTDSHWQRFCKAANWQDLANDPDLDTNNQRIAQRARLLERFAQFVGCRTADEVCAVCEEARIPFAPIRRPEDLFEDPHLAATGGLIEIKLPDGTPARLPKLPIQIEALNRDPVRNPPSVGQDTVAVLRQLGYAAAEIEALIDTKVVQCAVHEETVRDLKMGREHAG
ncbi:CaiB/BaiF CoA transferase family protein [Pacificispira sp.]|uniref:CaiB/BaiF CoA transferase family protein n=1 Tax=Pacificispira sp. TaxID=2888761 RepID=UPI003BA9BD81